VREEVEGLIDWGSLRKEAHYRNRGGERWVGERQCGNEEIGHRDRNGEEEKWDRVSVLS